MANHYDETAMQEAARQIAVSICERIEEQGPLAVDRLMALSDGARNVLFKSLATAAASILLDCGSSDGAA